MGAQSGIEIILCMMAHYPSVMTLQIHCSASLANLASIERNRLKLLEEGPIQLIIDSMTRFMDVTSVQIEICATLANLACHEPHAKLIAKKGGCGLILRSVRLLNNLKD